MAEKQAQRRKATPINTEIAAMAAADIISTGGLEGLTMRVLAAKLGCSVGTLTYHYKSKQELLDDVFSKLADLQQRRFQDLDFQGDVVEQLMQIFASSLPVTEDLDREWRLNLAYWGQALPASPGQMSEVGRTLGSARSVATEIFKVGQASGAISADYDAEKLAVELMSMTTGLGFSMLHVPMEARLPLLEGIRSYLQNLK